MKFQVGDRVLVTAGKDKGIKSEITRVVPKEGTVVVKGANIYTKHVKPYGDRAGEMRKVERPLAVAKVAILNDKDQPDRIGYKVMTDGRKERIFKKTGKVVPTGEKKSSKK